MFWRIFCSMYSVQAILQTIIVMNDISILQNLVKHLEVHINFCYVYSCWGYESHIKTCPLSASIHVYTIFRLWPLTFDFLGESADSSLFLSVLSLQQQQNHRLQCSVIWVKPIKYQNQYSCHVRLFIWRTSISILSWKIFPRITVFMYIYILFNHFGISV